MHVGELELHSPVPVQDIEGLPTTSKGFWHENVTESKYVYSSFCGWYSPLAGNSGAAHNTAISKTKWQNIHIKRKKGSLIILKWKTTDSYKHGSLKPKQ